MAFKVPNFQYNKHPEFRQTGNCFTGKMRKQGVFQTTVIFVNWNSKWYRPLHFLQQEKIRPHSSALANLVTKNGPPYQILWILKNPKFILSLCFKMEKQWTDKTAIHTNWASGLCIWVLLGFVIFCHLIDVEFHLQYRWIPPHAIKTG